MKASTTAISIHLPEELAEASQEIAKQLHISRARFIRMAIEHEIKAYEVKQEQLAIAHCFEAIRQRADYLSEADEIMSGLDTPLADDKDQWWKK